VIKSLQQMMWKIPTIRMCDPNSESDVRVMAVCPKKLSFRTKVYMVMGKSGLKLGPELAHFQKNR